MKTVTLAGVAAAAAGAVVVTMTKRAPRPEQEDAAVPAPVAELEPIDYTIPSTMEHWMLHTVTYWQDDDYGPGWLAKTKDRCGHPVEAELISSRLDTMNVRHAPILDIDLHAELVPEVGDTGRQALHLDMEMDARTYRRLVRALVRAGVARPSSVSATASFRPDGLPIDVPAALVASANKNHFHLYLDVEMTWRAYKRLLNALARAGVVEKSWVKASVQTEATLVRPPWRMKPRRSKENT